MKLSIIENAIWHYEDYVDNNILSCYPSYKMYPCLFPMWDNSSRRERGAWIFHDSTDVKFKRWLVETLKYFNPYSAEENFVFINAWNEWAEGNHLEPCQKWGTSYLEVIKNLFS